MFVIMLHQTIIFNLLTNKEMKRKLQDIINKRAKKIMEENKYVGNENDYDEMIDENILNDYE